MPKAPSQSGSEYKLVTDYKLGYRNREDITALPPGVLIVGSQNVLTNISERVQIRQGYTVDGSPSSTAAAVLASFDWLTAKGNLERHMRAGGLTSAGNDGKLQYRYENSSGSISWKDLLTGLSSVSYNFSTFWNTTELVREVIFVNGESQIQKWNGALATIASTTVTTITKSGTDSWLDSGFYASGNKQITSTATGITYTYTGGESTTTLTGVSPSPLAEVAGILFHQSVVTILNSAITDLPDTFENGLIATLNNQVFIGALNSSTLYISKVNNLTDFGQSTPRQAGQGAVLTLDDNLVALLPQESFMYVSCGQDLWYNVNFELQTSTVGTTYEQVNAERLKTGRRQGARSQAFVSHMKNNVITTTWEPTIDMIGRMENYYQTPQTSNLSDSIKLDVDVYDFEDGSIAYWRYYILVAVPKEGLFRIYNLSTKSWEAPQTIAISRFYIVNGELYGHSYSTFESYKLFTGYADRAYEGFPGHPIASKWVFSYQNFGLRADLKSANALYVEGYINPNTTLTATITYELDGCSTQKTFTLDGSNSQFVCVSNPLGSLGKESLGKSKLGGSGAMSVTGLPPKFRWIPTFNNTDFFECSVSFSVLGTDNRAELLAFGLNAERSTQEPVQKKD